MCIVVFLLLMLDSATEMKRKMELRHIFTDQINRGTYDKYCFGKGNEKVVSVRCLSRSKDCKITANYKMFMYIILCMILKI